MFSNVVLPLPEAPESTGAFQSDVALLGCDIQIPPNPPFSKGEMRMVSLFGQSAVFVPPFRQPDLLDFVMIPI